MIKWFKREKQAVLLSHFGKEYILNPNIPNKIGRSHSEHIIIGRNHSEHIIIEDDLNVSRENSVITYDKQTKTYYIEDVGSKHGTYVNGNKIIEKKELKNGDIIEIGKYTKFSFEIR